MSGQQSKNMTHYKTAFNKTDTCILIVLVAKFYGYAFMTF